MNDHGVIHPARAAGTPPPEPSSAERKKYFRGSTDGKKPLTRDPLEKARSAYDVVVIGSGLGGLTAANILGRAGHSVCLLEQHYNFGGLATWFKRRGGHVFDISLHGFPIGMKKTCRKYWSREIADRIVQLEAVRFENPQFSFATTFTREDFTEKLEQVFGVPRETVEAFFDHVRRMDFFDDSGETTGELFERFFPGRNDVHRLLMEPISYANGSSLEDPAITYGIVFSNFMSKGVYTFSGGTDELIRAMRGELAKNGVELYNDVQVERVVLEEGRVRGVQAAGRFIAAPTVLSNANLKTTVEKLLDPDLVDPDLVAASRAVRLNNSSCQVFLGVRKGEEIPFVGDLVFTSTRPTFDSPALCDFQGESRTFSFYYPKTRPGNRYSIVSSTNALWEDWASLDDESYEREKARLIEDTIVSLERLVPGIRAKLDHVEAATPRTFAFYTQHPTGTSFGTKFEGLQVSADIPKAVPASSMPAAWASSCPAGSVRRTTAPSRPTRSTRSSVRATNPWRCGRDGRLCRRGPPRDRGRDPPPRSLPLRGPRGRALRGGALLRVARPARRRLVPRALSRRARYPRCDPLGTRVPNRRPVRLGSARRLRERGRHPRPGEDRRSALQARRPPGRDALDTGGARGAPRPRLVLLRDRDQRGRDGAQDPLRPLGDDRHGADGGGPGRREGLMDWLGLTGKKVCVLGVANKKSVGFHVGRRLQEAGAEVVWVVHTPERRDELADRLAPGDVLVCDVEDEAQVERLRETLAERHPRLDGLVHSIAFANYSEGWKAFHETRKADFLQAVDISAFSLVAVSNAVKELLAPDASVVTVSISTTRMAAENYGYMAPAKAALDSAVVFLAKSFSAFSRVRFNAVCAGLLKTSSSAGIPGYVDSYLFAESCTLRKKALETGEVADTVLYLLSPRSSGINAKGIVVDAGMDVNYFDRDVVRRATRPDAEDAS